MLISLNWLKDFVAFPRDADPRELASHFTTTTAEVEGVERVTPNFRGVVAARIDAQEKVAREAELQRVVVAADKTYESLTSAPDLAVGDVVMYAPPGASVGGHAVGTTDPAGRKAEGMIVAGQSLGLVQVGANAMFLPPSFEPGQPIDTALFDDWLIEIDNKSITHRPDCWGHYGIAREFAAMLRTELRPYEVTDPATLQRDDLPTFPIEIDDPALCPRYSGLLMRGLRSQPAPLWMQVRLALVGMRPIDLLVDLTNYVMLELGQPMHAFDGDKVPSIQVGVANPGDQFTTLDDVTRKLPPSTLMIQSSRKNAAVAGVMGGAATEVTEQTQAVLLESANFDAPTIRRAATALGLRTEASARFEKSLDPANTILGIARFHRLATAELSGLELASGLSDCYPRPVEPMAIELDCDFAARFIGKDVSQSEIIDILERLEFRCEHVWDEPTDDPKAARPRRPAGIAETTAVNPSNEASKLRVTPPSYRATKDIEIEADLIEEVARYIGYNNIEPALPEVTTRYFEPARELALEERTLNYLCIGGGFVEVHNYIWFNDDWLKTLQFDPGDCITLRNPSADNCARLRTTLGPGLIAMAERNRQNLDAFQIVEIGSVFRHGVEQIEKAQHRVMGLVVAQSGGKAGPVVWNRLRSALGGWARQVLEDRVDYRAAEAQYPWEDSDRVAEVVIAGKPVGRVTLLGLPCKQRIDERLKSWSIALAEVHMVELAALIDRHEKLEPVPRHPQVELDFSVLADSKRRYADIKTQVATLNHPLLRRLMFVEAYEGGAIPAGQRSLTLRAQIGLGDRTLSDEEIQEFRETFQAFLEKNELKLRG